MTATIILVNAGRILKGPVTYHIFYSSQSFLSEKSRSNTTADRTQKEI